MRLGLRGRILAVVLGALLPLGLLGLWLARAAERSGEELLRDRMETSLRQAAGVVGANWVRQRSALLDLADGPTVREALREGGELPPPGSAEASPELRGAWERLAEFTLEVHLRDADGRDLVRFAEPGDASGAGLPVRLAVSGGGPGSPVGTLDARLRLASLLTDAAWWTGLGGSVLAAFDPRTGGALTPLPIEAGLLARDRFEWQGEQWLAVRRELREPPLVLALAAPLTPFQEPFRRATRRGTLALAAALAAALLLASLLSRRLTRSLAELGDAADSVARGELGRRVPERGPDELRRLARAFNSMSESLRRTLGELSRRDSLAAVGEFAAGLAHEIRNPLTSARLDLQRAARRAGEEGAPLDLVERALGQLSRLSETVDTALRLARSGRVERVPIDLRDPLDAALRRLEPDFRSRGTALEAPEPAGPLPVLGDAGALEQLFRNLLANAVEAVGPAGTVRVRAETDGGRIRVSVEDDGPGIPSELRERAFEPLFSTREGGTGLGLPVARRIAHAHGAELRIGEAPGGGAAVRLEIERREERPRPDRNDSKRGSHDP